MCGMKVISLLDSNKFPILFETEQILRSGNIVVAPTDTVYGILGDATNELVIKKIFALKKRSMEKAFPIFIKDITFARKLAYVSDAKAQFLESVWPGSTTVVFHHKEKLPKLLTGGLETLGMRIPKYPFLQELLQKIDFPLVQTSANISDRVPAKNIAEVQEYFAESEIKPDLVVDGGQIEGSPSAVINFTGSTPTILRSGHLSLEELNRMLGEFGER